MSTPIRACVRRIHRVLGVDERADAAAALSLGHDVVDERRLPRRLRAEDLDDAAARQAADPERHVERERACRDRSDRDLRTVAHAHDGPLAELPLDLAERDVERFLAIHRLILPALMGLRTALADTTRVPRTAPRTGADVKGKQRRRTERTARSRQRRRRAAAAPGTARR